MGNISPDDIKLLALAIAGPAVIVAVCIVTRGKERWLFMFGALFFIIVLAVLFGRGRW